MAKVSVGSLCSFNHENQDWSVYKERLEQWFLANELETDVKSKVKQRAILLSSLAETTFKLIRDLALPKKVTTLEYEAIVKLLDDHFEPAKCGFAERNRFYIATQDQSEGLAEWAARVRGLAVDCAFPSTCLNDLLRDRFVLGMQAGPERDKLFTMDMGDLTLSKALETAQAIRSARLGAAQSAPAAAAPLAEVPVFKMGAAAPAPAARHARPQRPQRAPGVGAPAAAEPRREYQDTATCEVCGYYGHRKDACRFKQYKCGRCGGRGHLRRVCRNNKVQQHFVEVEADDPGDDGDHDHTLGLDVSEVELYLYDFQNNYNLTYKINNSISDFTGQYNLDVSKRLVFFVPGYKSHISKNTENLVRNTFKTVPDIYLIIIDHSAYTSSNGGLMQSYERSVFYTYYIGMALGRVLADFQKAGFRSDNIHCIGHSLGSQMLSWTGTRYSELTQEKLGRITGLDPAGPCFSNSFIDHQIRAGVAKYVEVYHCNAGNLGTTSVLADTDFFLNKGTSEPHCDGGLLPGKSDSYKAKCSHKKCVTYYMETVGQRDWYLAWRCNTYKDFMSGKCAANEVAIAGYSNPGNVTGVFYASTETYGIF